MENVKYKKAIHPLKKYFALLLPLALAGCVANSPTKTPDDRFFQLVSPVNGKVAIQLAQPNGASCYFVLDSFKDSLFENLTSCSSTSSSSTLPYRIVLRNLSYDYLLDVDTIVLSECEAYWKSTKNGPAGDDWQLNKPCHKK